jgi:hypothetical protein
VNLTEFFGKVCDSLVSDEVVAPLPGENFVEVSLGLE